MAFLEYQSIAAVHLADLLLSEQYPIVHLKSHNNHCDIVHSLDIFDSWDKGFLQRV